MPNVTSFPEVFERCSESIANFVEQLGGKARSFEGFERRVHGRYVVAIPSIVQPLDDMLRPQGKPVRAVTRDISVGGVSLLHTEAVTTSFIGANLCPVNSREICLLIHVLRCTPVGAYYDVAGEFVTAPDA